MVYTTIEAIATGNPELGGSQEEAAAFMQRVESLPQPIRNRIPQIYSLASIDYRYTCVEDYGAEAEDFTFFPPNWALEPAPTTGQRNKKYREASVPLALRVAGQALSESGIAPEEITHVITVSCTGFFAPGLDVELVRQLGLVPTCKRTHVGFMGCYAAFPALRLAHSFCQSDPSARVLLVAVELCTVHFQITGALENAVVNALFSDGAAAVVLSAREDPTGRMVYEDGESTILPDSTGAMSWEIGDTGFTMGLSSRVPVYIEQGLPAFLASFLGRHQMTKDDVGFWAIHPGGRAIVDKAQAVLGLPPEAVHDSLEVLRLFGNMSSPTILFILKRFVDRFKAGRERGESAPERGVAMAFGPGLTVESALFRTY